VFGFCLKRQDWRLFKLMRLWDLTICDEHYTSRDIPDHKRDFNAQFTEDVKLAAIFDHSERYKLIETYGPGCYTETKEGLYLEIGFTKHDFMITWLLGFGDKVKVLEPMDIAENIKTIAQNILSYYK